ncbi:hypothetical protein NP493_1006g00010 [Ridgeia piscesae]|uniref:Uncharacterized protein n=1 Tax=Ridgeia piscesae TaxID=27915 RepID=A0AAD9KIG8_RIDPI|nr:hypothetical protein NP493_1006g00010 [Ridgeia piscesae]
MYIKHKLHVKHDEYKDNDKDKYKKARYAVEKAVKTGKAKYRDKLEVNLTTNNSKNIWQGLKAITNYMPSPKNTTATDTNLPDRFLQSCNREYSDMFYHSMVWDDYTEGNAQIKQSCENCFQNHSLS